MLDYVLATLNQVYLHLMNVKASRTRLVLLQIVTVTVATDMLHIVPGARMDQPGFVPSGERRRWMILKSHSGKVDDDVCAVACEWGLRNRNRMMAKG